MLVIKVTAMKDMPITCDECCWYGCAPHPAKGWTEMCEYMHHCIDDDQPEEWVYDGNGRVKACPLIEIAEKHEGKEIRAMGNHELADVYEVVRDVASCMPCSAESVLNWVHIFKTHGYKILKSK